MSYVADSTDVVFTTEPLLPHTANAFSDEDAAGAELSAEQHDGEYTAQQQQQDSYVTPYESFNLDPDAKSTVYAQVMDTSSDTMAAVYGSSDLAEAKGGAENVYAYSSERAAGAVAGEDESEDDDDDESEDDESEDEADSSNRRRRPLQTKNWNEEFQRLLSLEPSANKFTEMARLAHDFVFAAETYGKIIISELGLHESKKTLKPIAVGGQAGGEKYIVQGIFFKFATDIFGIYGGDEFAMKAASHDLKGLIHYYSCQIPGLHVPLMALIDYLGFRLIAITILPINSTTLRYGSCDAGVTIHCEDQTLNKMMKQAARKMNLRGHYVGTPEGLGKKIYGPVDIEGHKGTDDRYYVVDFARTFPPERPSPANVGRKGIILYNLLRPELVKANDTPLSSDAYTMWARADSKKDLYNLHVTQATETLIKTVIPKAADKLNQLQDSADKGKNHLDLIEVIHSMAARIVRKQIAEKFRRKTREMGIPTEEPQKIAAVKHLNMLLGRHRNSNLYWRTLKRSLVRKFPNCLLEHELDKRYDLRKSLDITAFFERLRTLSPNIIALTDEATKDFARAIKDKESAKWGEWVPNFKFLPSDMTALHASVKHMNLIDIAEASAMFYKGLDEKGNDQTRLLIQGLGKFQARRDIASRKMPFLNVDTIILLADMLVAQAQHFAGVKSDVDVPLILSNALIAYQTALNIQPTNTKCLVGVGNIHFRRHQWSDAIATYEEAIRLEPMMALAHLQLARVYKEKDHMLIRHALEIDPNYYEALVMLGELAVTRTYDLLMPRNVVEVDDANKQKMSEVGGLYERALSLRTDDVAYTFVDDIIAHAVEAAPKQRRWFDLALALLWQVAEASPAFKRMLSDKLARAESLYLRHCKAILTDSIFRGVMWACSSIHSLTLLENETVTEPTLMAWLEHHPVPLRELWLKGCPQFSSALILKLASLPRHAQALETLCVEGIPLSKGALLVSFGRTAVEPGVAGQDAPAEEGAIAGEPSTAQEMDDRWTHLATLIISLIPDVDNDVIEAVSRLPSLTRLEYNGCGAVTSSALDYLPAQLTQVSLGGGVSLPELTSLVKRCSGITRLCMKGVQGLAPEDAFKLAPLLPALTHYQIPTGNVYRYSGTKPFEVMFNDRGVIKFAIPNGPDLYQLRTQFNTTMEGEDFSLVINHSPAMKTIVDKGTLIARASFAMAAGWNIATLVGGLSTASLVQYQAMTRTFFIQPPMAAVHYVPQQGQARITIRPGTNITLLLAILFLGITSKQ